VRALFQAEKRVNVAELQHLTITLPLPDQTLHPAITKTLLPAALQLRCLLAGNDNAAVSVGCRCVCVFVSLCVCVCACVCVCVCVCV
jgi:hypothetical protein